MGTAKPRSELGSGSYFPWALPRVPRELVWELVYGRTSKMRHDTFQCHRDLRPFPLADALRAVSGAQPGALVITMGEGQWDATLRQAYELGWILLEIDERERPMRAYRKGAK